MSKKLTAEDLEVIEQRTKERLDNMRDDGWELEDIMALLDHITSATKPMPRNWHGPWVADGWQVIHRESGEAILTAVSIERAVDLAAGLNLLAWIQGREFLT